MNLIQPKLIDRVKDKANKDVRLKHVLMYGSWANGEGDEFSDIEFWIFVEPQHLPELNKDEWLEDIASVLFHTINESGADVAIFREGLVRGEFHFVGADTIDQIRGWTGLKVTADTISKMVFLDRSGELRAALDSLRTVSPVPKTDAEIELLCGRFVDWLLFGTNVLKRGELARSHVLLGILHGYLAWMARLDEGALDHWLTPTKGWENELSDESVARLRECSAIIEQDSLRKAYIETCDWGTKLIAELGREHHFEIPSELLAELAKRAKAV